MPRKPAGARPSRLKPPIALLTDFGMRDPYAGQMRAVIASIAEAATVIDLSHGVPPQDIVAGALILRSSRRFFPARTIFVAVVDPGVGTARCAIAIETRTGAIMIGPDNGLLSPAVEDAGVRRVVELTSTRYRLTEISDTFHGRDIFAPAAAHLWKGVSFARLGRALDGFERLNFGAPIIQGNQLVGNVIYVDGFGNLVSNITREQLAAYESCFQRRTLSVTIEGSAPMELGRTYAQAPGGSPLALFGSFQLLEVAIRDGNAAAHFKAGVGARVQVSAQAQQNLRPR